MERLIGIQQLRFQVQLLWGVVVDIYFKII